GEVAWRHMEASDGNATYRNRIIDAIYHMTPRQLEEEVDYAPFLQALYGITDESFVGDNSLEELVEKALRGGVTMIQYREKHRDDHEFKNMALKLKKICKTYSVPLIINDRVDIALAIDADGVHVGSEDMDPKEVRRLLGEDKIIGVSAKTEEEAIRAQADGA